MVEPLRHRQTKRAETDMPGLPPPRHIPTLPKYINYRDLSVQQLGSVYERILEHGLNVQDGQIEVAENPAARKGSGSYYTPEELVALIIERAVGPLVSELTARFTAKADQLAGETRAKAARLADLQPLDP